MNISGYLKELQPTQGDVVQYELATDVAAISLNSLIGQELHIQFSGVKACVHCGRKVKKLYQSGYCFPCVTSLAECDLCIMKPHECHFHLGTCRSDAFASSHCFIPHYVYLAVSSDVKVGLTRKGRQLKRWMDQGASQAVLFAELPTRKMAGELEVHLSAYMSDKTNWRKMLKQEYVNHVDLPALKDTISKGLPEEYSNKVITDHAIYDFRYPRMPSFEVITKSISLDKNPIMTTVLRGIKGQYLLLEDGVLNIKKHSGYWVEFSS